MISASQLTPVGSWGRQALPVLYVSLSPGVVLGEKITLDFSRFEVHLVEVLPEIG